MSVFSYKCIVNRSQCSINRLLAQVASPENVLQQLSNASDSNEAKLLRTKAVREHSMVTSNIMSLLEDKMMNLLERRALVECNSNDATCLAPSQKQRATAFVPVSCGHKHVIAE